MRAWMAVVVWGWLIGGAGVAAETPKIHWDETGGDIDLASVCAGYGYGSMVRRECLRLAKARFDERCRHFSQKFSASAYPRNLRYEKNKRKFCRAASQLNPL